MVMRIYYSMPVSKVTRNYQVTIPKEIREKLSMNAGDLLVFDIEDNRIVLRKDKLELPVLKGGKNLSVKMV